jgi:hypothetical protein
MTQVPHGMVQGYFLLGFSLVPPVFRVLSLANEGSRDSSVFRIGAVHQPSPIYSVVSTLSANLRSPPSEMPKSTGPVRLFGLCRNTRDTHAAIAPSDAYRVAVRRPYGPTKRSCSENRLLMKFNYPKSLLSCR